MVFLTHFLLTLNLEVFFFLKLFPIFVGHVSFQNRKKNHKIELILYPRIRNSTTYLKRGEGTFLILLCAHLTTHYISIEAVLHSNRFFLKELHNQYFFVLFSS